METDGVAARVKLVEHMEGETPAPDLYRAIFLVASAGKENKSVVGKRQSVDARTALTFRMVGGMETVFSRLFCSSRVEEPDSRVLKANHNVILPSVYCNASAPHGGRDAVLHSGNGWLYEVYNA